MEKVAKFIVVLAYSILGIGAVALAIFGIAVGACEWYAGFLRSPIECITVTTISVCVLVVLLNWYCTQGSS